MTAVIVAEDRSISVPQGTIVKTGYVDVFKIRLACRAVMSVGDISHAYQKRLQCGTNQPFPCPNGYWEGDTFILLDGRHEWVATVALGFTHILVAWVEAL